MRNLTVQEFKAFCEDHGVKMSLRMAYYIHRGESRLGLDRAVILSRSTGIPLEAWLRPEDVYNKYLDHLFGAKKAANDE